MTIRMLNMAIDNLKSQKESIFSKFGCENSVEFNENLDILIDIIDFIREDKRNEDTNFDGKELSTKFIKHMHEKFGIFKIGDDI